MIGHYKISQSASVAISYENNVTNNTSLLEKKKVYLRVEHLNPIVWDSFINMVYCLIWKSNIIFVEILSNNWFRNPIIHLLKFVSNKNVFNKNILRNWLSTR